MEQVAERAMIRATPETLFAIITDFESYPSWSGDVKAVRVLERDEHGRGIKVAFQVAAFGRSTTPTLVYDYRGAPHRLSWAQESGDLTRRYDGSYSFEESPTGDSEETEVRYQITVELKVSLPGFVKRRAESLVGVKVLRELKARAER